MGDTALTLLAAGVVGVGIGVGLVTATVAVRAIRRYLRDDD